MEYRLLGKTGWQVSEISLGTWQLGGKWGEPFDHDVAVETINRAIDAGINFIDTADVYRDGLSEQTVAEVVKARSEEVYVATKCGRRLQPHTNDAYTPEALRGFVEESLRNMQTETIDLIQLHCPPHEVYYRPEIFELFDRLREEGKIRNLGVSVEKVEEGLKAIEYPNVTTIQIIYNMFRLRPAEWFFPRAKERNVGVIVRVPLASGILAGKMSRDTTFGSQDHRTFNREGQAFDKGETFSGVEFDLGLEAVDALREVFPESEGSLAQWALAWVLMADEVSTVIPGASRVEHVESNAEAPSLLPLSQEQMARVREVYEKSLKPRVHQRW